MYCGRYGILYILGIYVVLVGKGGRQVGVITGVYIVSSQVVDTTYQPYNIDILPNSSGHVILSCDQENQVIAKRWSKH